jgi:hypothetical protein
LGSGQDTGNLAGHRRSQETNFAIRACNAFASTNTTKRDGGWEYRARVGFAPPHVLLRQVKRILWLNNAHHSQS